MFRQTDGVMLGLVFTYCLLLYICVGALAKPHIGVIGYYGFILLQPEWNWRWSIPQGMGFQKYIAIATVLGFLLSGMRGSRATATASCGVVLMSSFIGLMFLSYQGSIRPEPTWFYVDTLWKMILMAVIGVRVLDTPQKLVVLIVVLMLGQGYNAYQINESYFKYGVCFFTNQGFGPSGDNNLYSILTVPTMAASASVALYAKILWQKALAGGILLLQTHQIMLMESRGCMLGALFMLVIIVCLMPRTPFNVYSVIACAILAGVLAGPPVVKEFTSSFEKGENRDSSADSRFILWKNGFQIMTENPLLGVGPYAGQFRNADLLGAYGSAKGLHNLFFEVGAGCGIPALICYLGFFFVAGWSSFKLLWNQKREPIPDWLGCVSLAVFPGLVGYMASSMFSSGALLESSYALAVAGLAADSVWAAEKRRVRRFSPQPWQFREPALGIGQLPSRLMPN